MHHAPRTTHHASPTTHHACACPSPRLCPYSFFRLPRPSFLCLADSPVKIQSSPPTQAFPSRGRSRVSEIRDTPCSLRELPGSGSLQWPVCVVGLPAGGTENSLSICVPRAGAERGSGFSHALPHLFTTRLSPRLSGHLSPCCPFYHCNRVPPGVTLTPGIRKPTSEKKKCFRSEKQRISTFIHDFVQE